MAFPICPRCGVGERPNRKRAYCRKCDTERRTERRRARAARTVKICTRCGEAPTPSPRHSYCESCKVEAFHARARKGPRISEWESMIPETVGVPEPKPRSLAIITNKEYKHIMSIKLNDNVEFSTKRETPRLTAEQRAMMGAARDEARIMEYWFKNGCQEFYFPNDYSQVGYYA